MSFLDNHVTISQNRQAGEKRVFDHHRRYWKRSVALFFVNMVLFLFALMIFGNPFDWHTKSLLTLTALSLSGMAVCGCGYLCEKFNGRVAKENTYALTINGQSKIPTFASWRLFSVRPTYVYLAMVVIWGVLFCFALTNWLLLRWFGI